ncbi:hypothetical protein [Treponema brennaborense]|uniref:Lipoprotein n=1 Tax=Treponema brennaborense (strain DSM 12168 / CIP 105900 / DD5/3) TaxID=906968 RepID=F4LQI0_TREBD|nr:hypothetical protein [Treponema brennaborense]AEE17189.1 hypothetical protein Trebr_1767 [Treponema brennaborense DSM 12168]
MLKGRFFGGALFFICAAFSVFPCFAQDSRPADVRSGSYADAANRRTALRCLQLSKDYLLRREYRNAAGQAELGLAYDAEISELWYVLAASLNESGAPRAEVLSTLDSAFAKNVWVDSGRDNARLLYARLLCDTGEPGRALEVLDSGTFLYAAEAEYIRVLAYYRLGTSDGTRRAREKVDASSRVFPADSRFPLAFFSYELQNDLSYDPSVQPLADALITRFSDLQTDSAEFSIYAAAFTAGEPGERMLRAFNAAGLRHPLYAPLALKAGLIAEADAYEYFCSFAKESVPLPQLVRFASLLKDDAVLAAFKSFLNAYNGILLCDYSGDGLTDASISYARGRPARVSYDANQDGMIEWTAECDFGVPARIIVPESGYTVHYGKYPFVSRVEFTDGTIYRLVADTLAWTPLTLYADRELKETLGGFDFFVPAPKSDQTVLDRRSLAAAASSVEVPSDERSQARIRFAVLDGKFRLAQYFTGDTLYAQTQFSNGIPTVRTVDADGDGFFELTETFGFDPARSGSYADESETDALYGQLFGPLAFDPGVFIRSVSIDRDRDTVVDFTEEYAAAGARVSTWLDQTTGGWSARYSVLPDKKTAEAQFRLPLGGESVTVRMENGVPVRVTVQAVNGSYARDLPVSQDDTGVYWLGKAASAKTAKKVLDSLNRTGSQGVSLVVDGEPADDGSVPRVSAVRIGEFVFGVLQNE